MSNKPRTLPVILPTPPPSVGSVGSLLERLTEEFRRREDVQRGSGRDFLLSEIAALCQQVAALEAAVRGLTSGRSKSGSEKMDVGQLLLGLYELIGTAKTDDDGSEAQTTERSGDDEVDPATGLSRRMLDDAKQASAELDEQIQEAKAERQRREKRERSGAEGDKSAGRSERRQILDDPGVPHVEIPYMPSADECTCGECGGERIPIRYEVQRWLEHVPARTYVAERKVPVMACPCCREGMSTPLAPELALPGSMAGNSMLAGIVASKFSLYLPVHRQSQQHAFAHVPLPESTLSEWCSRGIEVLHEMFSPALEESVRQATVVHADPTTFRVLDPEKPRSSHRGTITGYVVDRVLAFCSYSPSGSPADGLWKTLRDFTGKLVHDGSNHFLRLVNGLVARALSFCCNAHARRKFVPFAEVDPRAAYIVSLYSRIWRVEELADRRGLDPPERVELRNAMARPVFEELRRYLTWIVERTPPTEPITRAARYVLKRFHDLSRYLDHGDVPPDNNIGERLLRCVRLTENNSLFAGSHESAERHATAWALARTCALHGVNFFDWLTDVFREYASGCTPARVRELLPHIWKQHPAHAASLLAPA